LTLTKIKATLSPVNNLISFLTVTIRRINNGLQSKKNHKANKMKKLILLSFLLQIVLSDYSYSQFDGYYGTINKRPTYGYNGLGTIMALGDQNNDGYDDFLICTGKYPDTLYTLYFYHGGPVIDTIPYFQFSLPFRTTTGPRVIIAPDINKDWFKDIIISVVRVNPAGGVLLVYYGGPILDSIPDQMVNQPIGEGASLGWASELTLIRDFDGDGNQELACYDPFIRYSNKYWGTIYFHKISNGIIDSIPFKILEGSQTDSIRIEKIKSHDINRDGLADCIIRKTKFLKNGYTEYSELLVYIGNSSWDVSTFTQSIRRYNQQEIIKLSYYTFYHDITLDGKTDVITEYVGDPYYHKGALLKGGFPVDTTIWKTLNTLNIYITTEIAEDFDANGDGVPDLLMKMYGLASHDTYLWLGSSNFQQYPVKRWYAQEYYEGVRSGNIGDVNGDGADDIYIGVADDNTTHTFPGKVHIYLGDTSVHVPITRVDEKDNEKPESYELLTAHPNPFNPETVISYELPVNSKVILGIYDILGREVSKLVDAEQEAGKHEVRFNGSGLATGVYIVRFSYRQSDGLEVINSLKIELIK